MAKTNPDTIVLKGGNVRKEFKAAGTIYPGNLIVLGSGNTVTAGYSAGQNIVPLFAIENEVNGDEISDAYASGAQVQAVFAQPGDEILAVLKDGQNAAIGNIVEAAGSGEVQVYAVDTTGNYYTNQQVGMVLEALNLTATGFALAARRVKILVL